MGSASELEYHLLLSKDLGYLSAVEHQKLQPQIEEVKRMLASLIRKVDSERI
jgi:four helix bundle protein